MRKELELIEKIEAYLQGRLSPAETQAFEEQMAGDPALQDEVELQRQLMTGIDRAGLREEVAKARKRYTLQQRLVKWGLGGLAAAAVTVGLLYYLSHADKLHSQHTYQDATLPDYNEAGKKKWADADKYLPAQSYLIDPDRDTVIETEKGIVLAIPAKAFLDEGDRPTKGQIQVVLKEALDPATIMTAGLSTRSDTQMLSTGGMFFLDARQGSQILHIDTTRPVTAQIPAAGDPSNMQLYKGKRMENGTINWVDPRPLEHSLTAVDIMTLDFYPPNYLDSLRTWGYDSKDRRFTDSLYFSFAGFYQRAVPQGEELPQGFYYAKTDSSYITGSCGIDPAKIRTIWSSKFQNTLLATREFEQRLHWLYISGRNDLLDLYIDHLDRNLSDIDSMVARKFDMDNGIFQAFARRHDGKVNNTSPQIRQLAAYYKMKTQVYTAAMTKAKNEYRSRQAALESLSNARAEQHMVDSFARVQQNYRQEFKVNFQAACRQLGYDTAIKPTPPATVVYTATITTTGWCNIDRAVTAATLNRTTVEYTDSTTNKKAVIRYLPMTVHITDWKSYDRLYVYLLPDQLSSFMRASGAEGAYAENLNELLRYRLVCIGYKGEQAWYYQQDKLAPVTYPDIRLSSISTEELTTRLALAGSMTQTMELQKENTFLQLDWQDQKRIRRNQQLDSLEFNTGSMLFHCWIHFGRPVSDTTSTEN